MRFKPPDVVNSAAGVPANHSCIQKRGRSPSFPEVEVKRFDVRVRQLDVVITVDVGV